MINFLSQHQYNIAVMCHVKSVISKYDIILITSRRKCSRQQKPILKSIHSHVFDMRTLCSSWYDRIVHSTHRDAFTISKQLFQNCKNINNIYTYCKLALKSNKLSFRMARIRQGYNTSDIVVVLSTYHPDSPFSIITRHQNLDLLGFIASWDYSQMHCTVWTSSLTNQTTAYNSTK